MRVLDSFGDGVRFIEGKREGVIVCTKSERFKSEKPSRFGNVGRMRDESEENRRRHSVLSRRERSETEFEVLPRTRQSVLGGRETERSHRKRASGDGVEHALGVCRLVIRRRTQTRFWRHWFEKNERCVCESVTNGSKLIESGVWLGGRVHARQQRRRARQVCY